MYANIHRVRFLVGALLAAASIIALSKNLHIDPNHTFRNSLHDFLLVRQAGVHPHYQRHVFLHGRHRFAHAEAVDDSGSKFISTSSRIDAARSNSTTVLVKDKDESSSKSQLQHESADESKGPLAVSVLSDTGVIKDNCRGELHTEYWGDVVQWGHPQPNAVACCRACRVYEPTVDVLKGALFSNNRDNPTEYHIYCMTAK